MVRVEHPGGQIWTVRGNRDTVDSAAVFDLDAGPVTVTVLSSSDAVAGAGDDTMRARIALTWQQSIFSVIVSAISAAPCALASGATETAVRILERALGATTPT